MRETAEHHERAGELGAALDLPAVGEPATYLRYLTRLGCEVDAWETTYLHVLDPDGEDENPVLTWVTATGLRPVLDILTDDEERAGVPRAVRRGARRGVPADPRRGCSSRSAGSSPSPARPRPRPDRPPAPAFPPDPGTFTHGTGTVPGSHPKVPA